MESQITIDVFFQLSYLKNSLAIISAVARLYPFFKCPCIIAPNIPLTISSSISQYDCISPDKAIATYSIGLLSNSLCSFALYPQHISICKPHLNIAVIHVIITFHDISIPLSLILSIHPSHYLALEKLHIIWQSLLFLL